MPNINEKSKERRTIKVSDRTYNMLNYGSKIFHISIADFLDKILNSYLDYESIDFSKFKEMSPVFEENRQMSPVSENLIAEGLKLIEEINPEKAKELRLKLKSLKSPVLDEKEQMSPVKNVLINDA